MKSLLLAASVLVALSALPSVSYGQAGPGGGSGSTGVGCTNPGEPAGVMGSGSGGDNGGASVWGGGPGLTGRCSGALVKSKHHRHPVSAMNPSVHPNSVVPPTGPPQKPQ